MLPAPSQPIIKVLIVEDEFLVAADLEATLEDLGFTPIGIAPDAKTAAELAIHQPDVAFVDLNLRDGPTGPSIAQRLVDDYGVAVIFVTANPRQLNGKLNGALGVITKPLSAMAIEPVINYAIQRRRGETTQPPRLLMSF